MEIHNLPPEYSKTVPNYFHCRMVGSRRALRKGWCLYSNNQPPTHSPSPQLSPAPNTLAFRTQSSHTRLPQTWRGRSLISLLRTTHPLSHREDFQAWDHDERFRVRGSSGWRPLLAISFLTPFSHYKILSRLFCRIAPHLALAPWRGICYYLRHKSRATWRHLDDPANSLFPPLAVGIVDYLHLIDPYKHK